MKIYTRTGDTGETGLFGGGRVSKDSVRVEAYGDVDELNACLGLALSGGLADATAERLTLVQGDLMSVGAHLATPEQESSRRRPILPPLPTGRIGEMEEWIDEIWEGLRPLKNFVLPGGVPGAATLHLARVVCRRAERSVVRLGREEDVEEGIIQYLNRLSDLLFALARLENHEVGKGDVVWSPAPAEGDGGAGEGKE
jgi:cob(I)alamin adenosyltransferase